MKEIYVVHSNEYSDSENFCAFINEQDAIDLIKKQDMKWNQQNFKDFPGSHLKRFKDDDGTTFFDIVGGKNAPEYLDGDLYSYDKLPLYGKSK